MRYVRLIALVVLAAVPTLLDAQAADSKSLPAQPQTADSPTQTYLLDITARKKTFLNESNDLEEMAKSLKGVEFDAVMAVDQRAAQATMELDATVWFLAIYNNMQCEPDREAAKSALKNRLSFYSYLLGLEADQVAARLVYMRLPATAQAGQRIKDELRAAQNKLDEIETSLK